MSSQRATGASENTSTDVSRFLGPHRYLWLTDLGRREGCAWHILRRETDGARVLAQIWRPLPSDHDLDLIREAFLSRFQDATPLDPIAAHLGFDGEQAWCLQVIEGTPLSRLWAGWGEDQRAALMRHLRSLLASDPHPRCLHPEVITFRPGLTQIPRALGIAPWRLDEVPGFLPRTAPAPALSEDLPWNHPRDLSEPIARPIRGRRQELPYLKSLMLGLSAPMPMERIVLLQGEEGVGEDHLAAWACAVAESEGIWVHHVAASEEEPSGRLLGRLIDTLLAGSEVDFYAQRPEAAKALAQRVQAFAFLTAGRQAQNAEMGREPEEVKAALEVLDFAGLVHPRLVHLSGLDRATPEALALIRELVRASATPWLLSLAAGTQGAGLKPLVSQLKGESSAAVVGVNRLEDDDMRLALEDLLGRHELPEAFRADLITQSLGNPGLLRNFLELAQQAGALIWEQERWALAPGHSTVLKAEEDLMRQILLGRLQRLAPPSAALVRLLALAERELTVDTLGRLLGLQEDAMEDALHGAQNSRLVQVHRGHAFIPDPRWRGLVLAQTPQAELKRLARALVAVLQDQGAACPVSLQSLASDEATALAGLLASIGQVPPGPPHDVARAVNQALQLKPSPWDEARLHEHLADAWALGPTAMQHPLVPPDPEEAVNRPPARLALEALDRALAALARMPESEKVQLTEARLHRKRAAMFLRLPLPAEAQEALTAAASRLADHPLHPEQSKLRLILGQIHLLQGHQAKGIRALEEGLQSRRGHHLPPLDQAEFQLHLGRIHAGQSQLLRATALLESARGLLEQSEDPRHLAPIQIALGETRLALGEPETSVQLMRDALQSARTQGDLTLQAQGHFALGRVRSQQQFLGPALSHLDRALALAQRLGDAAQASSIQIWRAHTFAALGDPVAADHAQFQALAARPPVMPPEDEGDHLLLQGEVARFRGAWKDTVRLFRAAADHCEAKGLLWRQRLALLRLSQALTRGAKHYGQEFPEQGWAILESLKGPVEGSGSRWLELEWHRAHAQSLSAIPPTPAVLPEALAAWNQVRTAARDMDFPAQVIEASMEGAQLLLQLGERLAAKSRMQEAFPSFQQLWIRLPESHETAFLGREDMHRFRQTVEACGLRFIQPDRSDPPMDWTPTQMNLPSFPAPA